MKHFFLGIVGVAIAVALLFVFLHQNAVAPEDTSTATQTPVVSTGNITVDSPRSGDVVGHTIEVSGTERTFEQNVVWQLRTPSGTVIDQGNTTGHGMDAGQFGPYDITISVPGDVSGNLEVWVFDYSAKDGAQIELVKVPVTVR